MSEIKYFSKSRGEFVEIAPMPTRHLSNAAKKLATAIWHVAIKDDGVGDEYITLVNSQDQEATEDHSGNANDVLCAMIDELASRVPAAGSGGPIQ